jgi:hypothetical protein
VTTSNYNADEGTGSGAQVALITRSGTNNWHGAGYWRYDGATFNAVTPEQARNGTTSPPAFVENIPGFRIGGPIVKNKLFVFGSSQWDRLRGAEQGAQIIIPTAAGVATLQSLNNPQAQILLNSLGGAVSIRLAFERPCAGVAVDDSMITPGRATEGAVERHAGETRRS